MHMQEFILVSLCREIVEHEVHLEQMETLVPMDCLALMEMKEHLVFLDLLDQLDLQEDQEILVHKEDE